MENSITLDIRDVQDFVRFCKHYEVQTIFRHRGNYSNRYDDDDFNGKEPTAFSWKGICKFQGYPTTFRMPINELVPPGWQLDAAEKILLRSFERKSDVMDMLKFLGANVDHVQALRQVKSEYLKTVSDESTEEEDRVVIVEKHKVPDLLFAVNKFGMTSVKLVVEQRHSHTSKLKYILRGDWERRFDETIEEVETLLLEKIPSINIFNGNIST